MENVGIICGGFSSEFEISVKSARNIQANFPNRLEAFLIHLSKEGWKIEVNGELIDFDERSFTFIDQEGRERKIDLAVVFIHGDPGENGKVQAYLEMINIPYLNSGPLASELSFDKWYCNQFLRAFDIPVARSVHLISDSDEIDFNKIIDDLGLPVFVKPCDSGSSYGIARVNDRESLQPAIENAFKEGRTVVIEEFLNGIEVTCAVYESVEGIQTLPLTEIVSKNEFFDYDAKYKGLSDEITPARIDNDITKEIQKETKKIYQLLNLRSIARVDFMLVNNTPYVIEVNTIPGFSNESIIPKMLSTKGMTTQELWEDILKKEGF